MRFGSGPFLGFLGGLAIAGIVFWSMYSARPVSGASLALIGFLWIAREASNYRDHLERTIIDDPYYTEQYLARGLEIVPMLAGLGAFTAFLIIVSEWMFPRIRRRRRTNKTAAASGI